MLSLDLSSLRAAYAAGLTPTALVSDLLRRLDAYDDPALWIHRLSADELRAHARWVESRGRESQPLYGIPFAIKDNIDLAGAPTTAACREFAYTPDTSAPVVQRLIDAGAIPIGKVNLDQFATGLVGVRSPFGAPRNPFRADVIPGGSSSGSAVAVAAGLVSFALGTDTAGSGRVPAGLNNLVGLKPSKGALSTRGVVPACRSLDCVSVFALTCADAAAVLEVAEAFDPADPFSRPRPTRLDVGRGLPTPPGSPMWAGGTHPAKADGAASPRGEGTPPTIPARRGRETPPHIRVGVPGRAALEFFGDAEAERLFHESLTRVREIGGEVVEIDFGPFRETAALLYQGPWVAERWAALRNFHTRHAGAFHPITRKIIEGANTLSAADAFDGFYRLAELARRAAAEWEKMDVLLLPTAPRPYTLAEVAAEPITANSRLGTYTNFVNLLDLSALAVPAGLRSDSVPWGVTLIAPAWSEALLLSIGARWHAAVGGRLGATATPLVAVGGELARHSGINEPAAPVTSVRLAVVGAHLSGLPLNHQLTDRGATLAWTGTTAPQYRLYALPGTTPPKPGMVRVADKGSAIAVEVWDVPMDAFGSFVAGVPPPLCIGSITLSTGEIVKSFLCESAALTGADDITAFGGWPAFLASRR